MKERGAKEWGFAALLQDAHGCVLGKVRMRVLSIRLITYGSITGQMMGCRLSTRLITYRSITGQMM